MSDESSKTMMVDERQSVRQVLDSLLDKSHCGYSPDWSLVETITELQMGKPAVHPDSTKHAYWCWRQVFHCAIIFSRTYIWGPWELGGEPVKLDPGQPQQAHVHRAHREVRSLQEPPGKRPLICSCRARKHIVYACWVLTQLPVREGTWK